jgi:hypothetical protein
MSQQAGAVAQAAQQQQQLQQQKQQLSTQQSLRQAQGLAGLQQRQQTTQQIETQLGKVSAYKGQLETYGKELKQAEENIPKQEQYNRAFEAYRMVAVTGNPIWYSRYNIGNIPKDIVTKAYSDFKGAVAESSFRTGDVSKIDPLSRASLAPTIKPITDITILPSSTLPGVSGASLVSQPTAYYPTNFMGPLPSGAVYSSSVSVPTIVTPNIPSQSLQSAISSLTSSKGSYDISTGVYTAPSGFQQSMAVSSVPRGTEITSPSLQYSQSFQSYQQSVLPGQVKTYQSLGFTKPESTYLAQQGLLKGGVTFSSDYAKQLIDQQAQQVKGVSTYGALGLIVGQPNNLLSVGKEFAGKVLDSPSVKTAFGSLAKYPLGIITTEGAERETFTDIAKGNLFQKEVLPLPSLIMGREVSTSVFKPFSPTFAVKLQKQEEAYKNLVKDYNKASDDYTTITNNLEKDYSEGKITADEFNTRNDTAYAKVTNIEQKLKNYTSLQKEAQLTGKNELAAAAVTGGASVVEYLTPVGILKNLPSDILNVREQFKEGDIKEGLVSASVTGLNVLAGAGGKVVGESVNFFKTAARTAEFGKVTERGALGLALTGKAARIEKTIVKTGESVPFFGKYAAPVKATALVVTPAVTLGGINYLSSISEGASQKSAIGYAVGSTLPFLIAPASEKVYSLLSPTQRELRVISKAENILATSEKQTAKLNREYIKASEKFGFSPYATEGGRIVEKPTLELGRSKTTLSTLKTNLPEEGSRLKTLSDIGKEGKATLQKTSREDLFSLKQSTMGPTKKVKLFAGVSEEGKSIFVTKQLPSLEPTFGKMFEVKSNQFIASIAKTTGQKVNILGTSANLNKAGKGIAREAFFGAGKGRYVAFESAGPRLGRKPKQLQLLETEIGRKLSPTQVARTSRIEGGVKVEYRVLKPAKGKNLYLSDLEMLGKKATAKSFKSGSILKTEIYKFKTTPKGQELKLDITLNPETGFQGIKKSITTYKDIYGTSEAIKGTPKVLPGESKFFYIKPTITKTPLSKTFGGGEIVVTPIKPKPLTKLELAELSSKITPASLPKIRAERAPKSGRISISKKFIESKYPTYVGGTKLTSASATLGETYMGGVSMETTYLPTKSPIKELSLISVPSVTMISPQVSYLAPRVSVDMKSLENQRTIKLQKPTTILTSIETQKTQQQQRQQLRQQQLQKQQQKQLERNLSISKIQTGKVKVSPRIEPNKISKFFKPKSEEEINQEKKKKFGSELFIPQVRRYGKYGAVSAPTSFEKALQIGVGKIRSTLGASLQVKKARTGELIPIAKSTREFRPGKKGTDIFTLTQRSRERISSFGEKAEILQSRRIGRNKFI